MRNIIAFLINYHAFLLFLLLEGISFFLLFRNNHYQRTFYVNTVKDMNGKMMENQNEIISYFRLKTINDSLAQYNADLLTHIQELSTIIYPERDTAWCEPFTYISAKVVNNTISKTHNFITINKGKKQGVLAEMSVISKNGVVGIVKEVSDNYAVVISMLNQDIRISAKLQETEHFGSVEWRGVNPTIATLIDIPKHVKVTTGDTVVTSGYSQIFPENIPVGYVRRSQAVPGSNFIEIELNLSTNFSNLDYVYVVNSLYKDEIKHLEQAAIQQP